jgi:hypothetical protein
MLVPLVCEDKTLPTECELHQQIQQEKPQSGLAIVLHCFRATKISHNHFKHGFVETPLASLPNHTTKYLVRAVALI